MNTKTTTDRIEVVRTRLERVMMELNPTGTPNGHKMYLAGMIDTLHEEGRIEDEVRDTLYTEFCTSTT